MPCPVCGTVTGKVHGYHRRRLACTDLDCPRQTFHEQIPGLAERYARRPPPLAQLVGAFAVAVAGRAASSLLAAAGVALSGTAVLAALMALPDPATPVPEAIGVDDFTLKRLLRKRTLLAGTPSVTTTISEEPLGEIPPIEHSWWRSANNSLIDASGVSSPRRLSDHAVEAHRWAPNGRRWPGPARGTRRAVGEPSVDVRWRHAHA